MRYTTFRYNAETCQYERVRLSAKSVFWYCLGLGVVASCMLVGIFLLHDLLINTSRETRLRKENRALQRHHELLTVQLNELQPVLASLQHKDEVLHEKFFGSPPVAQPEEIDRASKQKLLLADPDSFRKQVALLSATSEKLIEQSSATNLHFAGKFELVKPTIEKSNALPTLQPVQAWDSERMFSGFGMRVNPFHKGLYKHLGVDIAVPRGTPVLATATGKVVQLKRSDLQAGYGNYLEVDHGNGIVTRYAHLEDITVKFGARVMKGDTIGTVGTSGGSVAPHMHYEVLRDGENVDPVHYMVQGLSANEHHLLTTMSHKQNQSLD